MFGKSNLYCTFLLLLPFLILYYSILPTVTASSPATFWNLSPPAFVRVPRFLPSHLRTQDLILCGGMAQQTGHQKANSTASLPSLHLSTSRIINTIKTGLVQCIETFIFQTTPKRLRGGGERSAGGEVMTPSKHRVR